MGCLACDPVFSLCVSASRCDTGEALVGVTVHVRHEDHLVAKLHTGPKGEACITDLGREPPSPLDVTYEKPGYRTLQATLNDPGPTLPPICLEPEECNDPECSGD